MHDEHSKQRQNFHDRSLEDLQKYGLGHHGQIGLLPLDPSDCLPCINNIISSFCFKYCIQVNFSFIITNSF